MNDIKLHNNLEIITKANIVTLSIKKYITSKDNKHLYIDTEENVLLPKDIVYALVNKHKDNTNFEYLQDQYQSTIIINI